MERDARLSARANYFFALLPDPAAAAAADRMAKALVRWFDLSGCPRTDKYHVSLWGWPAFAEPDGQGLALMRRAAQRVRQAAFKLTLDEVATFAQRANKKALVITGRDTVIGVDRLHDALDREMRSVGFRNRRASHQPHLTFLYDHRAIPMVRVRALSWLATDFVLIRSVPKQDYEVLGRWSLHEPPCNLASVPCAGCGHAPLL